MLQCKFCCESFCGGAFHGASLEQPTVFHERDRDIEIRRLKKIVNSTMKSNYAKNSCLEAVGTKFTLNQRDEGADPFTFFFTNANEDVVNRDNKVNL